MGKGLQIIVYDVFMVFYKGLCDVVVFIVEEVGILYQFDVIVGGGIDLGVIYLMVNGVFVFFIIIVICYIYIYVVMLYCDDYENVVKLIIEVIKKLDW